MQNYTTIARYSFTFEYIILKLLLDKAGIRYFLKNEHFASIMPMSAIGNNGILLMVHLDDKDEALEILKDFNASDSPLKLVWSYQHYISYYYLCFKFLKLNDSYYGVLITAITFLSWSWFLSS